MPGGPARSRPVPTSRCACPIAQATHAAVREVAHRHRDPERVDAVAGVLKAFALKTELKDRKGIRWQPPTDVPAARGRADSGDLELDLVELFTDVAELGRDLGVGIGLFVDEMQDIASDELAAICGAVHEISQQGAPLVVVGAGLPHLPVVLSASKSYAERLFRYVSVDRLPRDMADRAWLVPAAEEGVAYEPEALDALYELTDGYPYFVQAYGKVTWDVAVGSPIRPDDVAAAAPEAEAELAVGFFGSRYDRATPAERDYMRTMADLGADQVAGGSDRVTTADIAKSLGRRPQSLSPGAGRADQEGADLLRRAGVGGVHRAALRAVPAQPALTGPAPETGTSSPIPVPDFRSAELAPVSAPPRSPRGRSTGSPRAVARAQDAQVADPVVGDAAVVGLLLGDVRPVGVVDVEAIAHASGVADDLAVGDVGDGEDVVRRLEPAAEHRRDHLVGPRCPPRRGWR